MIEYGHEIVDKTIYDSKIISEKHIFEVSQFSTRDSMLRDIIEAMGVLTRKETNKLSLEIKVDAKERYRIVKKWEV